MDWIHINNKIVRKSLFFFKKKLSQAQFHKKGTLETMIFLALFPRNCLRQCPILNICNFFLDFFSSFIFFYSSLNSNAFTGTFPTEIGHLTSLVTLSVFDNGFSGAIPTELGGIPTLIAL